jgi:polyisoprenoid-binding protein YceI
MNLRTRLPRKSLAVFVLIVLPILVCPVWAQGAEFQLDPANTTVKFTLDAVLHKVDGSFQVKSGTLQFDSDSGKISGEISVDAKSGVTGNAMRDRKMHKDVLESDRYPDIQFTPDHVDGALANSGKSSVRVHGIFRIHGIDREIEVPAVVEITANSWTAAIHFTVPYAKWGMKNPSNLFLHVSDSVEIDLAAAGKIVQHSAQSQASAQ